MLHEAKITINLQDDDKLLMRKAIGTGEYEGKHFEFGIVVPYSMYVTCEGHTVTLDTQSFCQEALKLIKRRYHDSQGTEST